MAPQNSTLIQPSGNSSPLCYDATVAATTSSDIASDLSRISPILPGKNTHPSNRRPWPGLADQPDNEAEVSYYNALCGFYSNSYPAIIHFSGYIILIDCRSRAVQV